jgi:hypothetical protein
MACRNDYHSPGYPQNGKVYCTNCGDFLWNKEDEN